MSSLTGNGQKDQCAVPLREMVSWKKLMSNGRNSPTEHVGSPGELGQVNFLSRLQSSPAGKLGRAQEPFSENQISSLSQALSLGKKLPQNEKQEGSFSNCKGDSRAVRECWAKRQCN